MKSKTPKHTAHQKKEETAYRSCSDDVLQNTGTPDAPSHQTKAHSISRLDGTRVSVTEEARVANDETGHDSTADGDDDFKQPQNIFITQLDRERIEKLLESVEPDLNLEMLQAELDRATIVPSEEIPPNVVTMNSRVRFADMTTKDETEFTLTYPSMANIDTGRVSILSPVGAALLGLKTGDEIEWPMPLGRKRMLKIISIPYQPEAQGDFNL